MGGTIGPILMLTETYNIFGYGLGGTHVNIENSSRKMDYIHAYHFDETLT